MKRFKKIILALLVIFIVIQFIQPARNQNGHYPWYSFIQPGAWLMASHIKNGKAMLNFSLFGDLSNRKQQSKLQGMINQVKDGEMPIASYTLIHKNAVLSTAQKTILVNWAASAKDSLSFKN